MGIATSADDMVAQTLALVADPESGLRRAAAARDALQAHHAPAVAEKAIDGLLSDLGLAVAPPGAGGA